MHDCPTCGLPTPEGNFCVRCGAPLDQQLERSRHRQQFAAAPGEDRRAPWPVTTLFPHLPQHSERHFRVALVIGAVVVIVLGALRLFPVALIAAALLMPVLAILYFYDVDVYEGEPAWAAGWTIGWGALTGVGVGLLAKAIAPTGPALIDRGSTAHIVTGGILLPALGVVLMLAGPLFLLRRARFNETLDGATFGAVTAASFAAAEAIVVGVDVLKGGLRPSGVALPWVERLLSLGVATPVLSMSAIGAATAAAWLRYRAPVKDRQALGGLGRPAWAILLAAALILAGAIGDTFMPAGLWLLWLIVLDLVGLTLLRRAIHVGLLEESSEREIGPAIRCANCGATTAAHTFCGNCGVALQALPKGPQAADSPALARGAFAGRLAAERQGRPSGHRRLLAGGVAFLAIVGIGFAIAALAAPPARHSRCRPGVPCGAPPIMARALATFPGYTAWTSSGLGYSLRYNGNHWSIAQQGSDSVQLQAADGFSVLAINAVPSTQASPSQLLAHQVSSLQGQLLGMSLDSNPSDQLLGTNVGLTPGPGAVYTATVDSPQGPQALADLAVLAASNGTTTICATVVAPGDDTRDRQAVYQEADDILDSIQFSTP